MSFTRTPQASSDEPLVSLLHAFPCGYILLRDSLAASGHFLLPWITCTSLAQGHKVVCIAAAYSATKHRAALRKLGAPGITAAAAMPGQASSNSSSIAFVSPAEQQQQQEPPGPSVGSNSVPVTSTLPRLQQLYQRVEAAARQLLQQQQPVQHQQQQQQHLTVVVDSLTVLSSLVCDAQQTAALLHQLAGLGELLQVPLRFVLLASSDTEVDNQLVAAAAAAARAHVLLDIAPLEGRTAALDGSMTVAVRRACRTTAGQQQRQHEEAARVGLSGVRPGWLFPGSSSVWFFRAGDVATRWLPEVHGKELIV